MADALHNLDKRIKKNCWEAMDCPKGTKEKCRAWPDRGKECWKLLGTLCSREQMALSTLAEKIIHCRNNCSYYKDYIAPAYGRGRPHTSGFSLLSLRRIKPPLRVM